MRATAKKEAITVERRNGHPVIGYRFIHAAIDDHSRLADSEVLTDERKETAAAFWQRANAFFAGHGITAERVLTDNGSRYGPSCSPRPAPSTNAPGRTVGRQTARWSASIAPCSTNGRTCARTPATPNALRH